MGCYVLEHLVQARKVNMKSEERHHLKTNDLAETISHVPDYIKQYGSRALTAVIVILMIAVGYSWYNRVSTANKMERYGRLQELLSSPDQLQQLAMRHAHAMAADSEGEQAVDMATLEGYNTDTLKRGLSELAENAKGTSVGAIALITQAETVRSELYFSDQAITAADKEKLISSATQLYQKALQDYASDASTVLSAKLGLAMLAEDKRDWDAAGQQYQAIISEGEAQFLGLAGVLTAQSRLAGLDNWKNAPVPVIVEVSEPVDTEVVTEPVDS